MNQSIRGALLEAMRNRRRALTERETALEREGETLLQRAMNRPTVTVRQELRFLLMAVSLMLIRRRKALLQQAIRRLERRTR